MAALCHRYTTTKLGKVMENVLKQNNTLNLEEMYFEDVEPVLDVNKKMVVTMAKFKDHSGRRRPVSCLAWQKVCGHSVGFY